MKVAIMQPAFIPPASYFRLFAVCDLFVILDDVQFNRRWYTHRQKLTKVNSSKDWLTLPLKKTDRDTTRIMDIEWAEDVRSIWEAEVRKFKIFDYENGSPPLLPLMTTMLMDTPFKHITHLMNHIMADLKIHTPKMRASDFRIPRDIKGQERILELCRILKAREYINSPGGRDLYDEGEFKKSGINLKFLPDYNGSYDSLLERFQSEKPEDIKKEIYANL